MDGIGQPCVFGNGGACLMAVVGGVWMAVVSLVLCVWSPLCSAFLTTSWYVLVPVSLYNYLRPRWKPLLFI